jgi:hypothetical protein
MCPVTAGTKQPKKGFVSAKPGLERPKGAEHIQACYAQYDFSFFALLILFLLFHSYF